MLILQRNKRFAQWLCMQALLMWPCLPGVDTGQARPMRKPFITLHNQHFIEDYHLYFNSFILPRPENLYVILARRYELPEDGILNVETCRSKLLIIIVFDIIVQSFVNL